MVRKISLLPNIITAFGLSCGLFVLYNTVLFPYTAAPFLLLHSASILILIAAFADVADGAIARLIKAESDFGGEFDSLSDSVTFGVAPPAVILHCLAHSEFSRLFNLFFILAGMVFTLCGVLRLVRYNLTRKIARPVALKGYFVGLPIPAGAALVLSVALFLASPWAQQHLNLSLSSQALLLMGIFVAVGYFMVSRFYFPSLSRLYLRLPTFFLALTVGIFAVFVLYGILNDFPWTFLLLSWGYLLLCCLRILYRLFRGKIILAPHALEHLMDNDGGRHNR